MTKIYNTKLLSRRLINLISPQVPQRAPFRLSTITPTGRVLLLLSCNECWML